MPGGYGTSGPWGSSGDTYSQPEPSWQQQGGEGPPSILNPPATFSQPTETFSGTGDGSEYSGTGSPYFTTGYPDQYGNWAGTVVPEQKPITNPSDMMIGNLFAAELAKDPKYGKEFVDPGQGIYPTNTLGKIMAVDNSGNMILDSSGNPIFTGFGKQMVDEFQANWDPSNPMDITLPGVFKEMAGDVIGKEKEYFKDTGSATQGGGGYGYGLSLIHI